MNFFGYIREWFIYATQQFVNLAFWAYDATIIPDFVGDIFNYLSDFTSAVAGYLWTASSWYDEVTARVAQIVSLDNIYSYFRTYFDYAVNAYNWVLNSWVNVTSIIDSWWYDAQQTILSLISNLETWTVTQLNDMGTWVLALVSNIETWTTAELNTVREWVLTLIADIETITPDLLDSVRTFLLSVISDIELWTITEFNNVTNQFIDLLFSAKAWTLTQVDNIKTAILTIITDLELWTTTEFNNIREMIGAALPWDDILALIISWGAIPGAAVQDLINSTLQSWFPFYDTLSQLWDSIAEFITDPWQWLYDRAEDLFDRFW